MILKKKIAVFGGSFDPIHNGHLFAAQKALSSGRVDQVLFIPTLYSPNKTPSLSLHRVNMIKLAIRNYPAFSISEIEIDRNSVSLTSATMKELKSKFPDDKMFLLIGSDLLKGLSSWHNVEYILERFEFLVVNRNKESGEPLPSFIRSRVHYLDSRNMVDISSTLIRSLLKEGKSIIDFIPKNVYKYILDNSLYSQEN